MQVNPKLLSTDLRLMKVILVFESRKLILMFTTQALTCCFEIHNIFKHWWSKCYHLSTHLWTKINALWYHIPVKIEIPKKRLPFYYRNTQNEENWECTFAVFFPFSFFKSIYLIKIGIQGYHTETLPQKYHAWSITNLWQTICLMLVWTPNSVISRKRKTAYFHLQHYCTVI